MKIYGFRVPLMASLIVWIALWEVIGRTGAALVLPPFSSVVERMVEIVPTPTFLKALAMTGEAYLIGNLIAIGIGVPVGVLMGRSVVADRLLLPWVNIFLSAPLSALVPVIMVLFGLGMTTIVLTVVLFAVWIIVLDARAGVRGISPSLVEMARSYGATPLQAFAKIYLWAALPEILAGIRLGCIRAVKGVIIGQLLVSIVGFGHLFEIYFSNFLMEHFWALVLTLFAFAFAIAEGLGYLERRVEYYASSRQQ
ncbi:MAG: ABC transporter permease subunit [Rhodospirillaceae bacterium]|nr:ABC transporter permease subunit [Rhodospirillaceae bacterium]